MSSNVTRFPRKTKAKRPVVAARLKQRKRRSHEADVKPAPPPLTEQQIETEVRKQNARVFQGGMILSVAWLASSYWTFLGYMKTAEETATASFTGSIQALLASVVAAVVVAGCSSLLLGFSGSGGGDE